MDVMDCIMRRRSIRVYQDIPVKRDDMVKLITAAMHAPSACNRQAWKFLWINDNVLKSEIAINGSPIIEKAPSGILVLYRNDLSYNSHLYKDHFQSASAAIENLLLAATDLGLGACWICNLQRPKKIKKILHVPSNFDVIAYITLGYPQVDDSALSVKHYGSLIKYREHERGFMISQVLNENYFLKSSGDCTMLKTKKYSKFINLIYKLPVPFISKIENKL